jgi:hypothetical protein
MATYSFDYMNDTMIVLNTKNGKLRLTKRRRYGWSLPDWYELIGNF